MSQVPTLISLFLFAGICSCVQAGQRENQQMGLEMHNAYRAKHQVSPLKLNETLNRKAQDFAEYLIKTHTFRNQVEQGILKNLYSYKGDPTEPPIDEVLAVQGAVTKWYDSMSKYNWDRPGYTAFTAIVWKETTDLGIGVANKGSRTIVVGTYSPPGNIEGDDGKYFKENVNRPSS